MSDGNVQHGKRQRQKNTERKPYKGRWEREFGGQWHREEGIKMGKYTRYTTLYNVG